ncbi:MAG: DUF1616 domain-containing protein [Methanotrichaceae archaeon]|nr:DUF1616 domain-containing protein [Methanotrichaceae archaeon]
MPTKTESIPSDLLAAAILALAMLVFTLTPLSDLPVRIPLGLLMVLFVPGYSLIAALFPKKADLEGIERTALSFGLSIAVVPLIGLGLNYTPWGIRLTPVVISLAIFTITMAAAARWRRMNLPAEERFSIHFCETISSWKAEIQEDDKSRLDKALTIILILTIFLSIAALVYVVVTPKQGEKFTEFYILGQGGKAYDYPTSVQAGNGSTLIVGVVNHEYAPVNYTVSISLNNTPVNNTIIKDNFREGFKLVYPVMSMNLTLPHNETWEKPVTYILNQTGDSQKLEFLLYKEGNFTSPYRDLHLWVNVSQNGLSPANEDVYQTRARFTGRK